MLNWYNLYCEFSGDASGRTGREPDNWNRNKEEKTNSRDDLPRSGDKMVQIAYGGRNEILEELCKHTNTTDIRNTSNLLNNVKEYLFNMIML